MLRSGAGSGNERMPVAHETTQSVHFGAGALEHLYPCRMSKKKKRRHRLGGPSPQNVALGQRELIVRTVAQDPNVQLRINPAGVAKMSDVLLRFAEPILDDGINPDRRFVQQQ